MIAGKRVPAAYRRNNRVSHLTADAVRQMGYVLEDSGKKLTVGQQRPRRRTQRGGTVQDGDSVPHLDDSLTEESLQLLESLDVDTDSDDEQPEPKATVAERRQALLDASGTSVVLAPAWRTKALGAKNFNPYEYIRLSETWSDRGIRFDDFDTKFPLMRGDINAVQLDRRIGVLGEYADYLDGVIGILGSNASNESDAGRIATVVAERDWATSQIHVVAIEQRQQRKAQHDADVAPFHGFGNDSSVGPDARLHVDDTAQSMYASQRGAASPRRHSIDLGAAWPRRHSIDLGAVSPIAGTAVGPGDTSVAALGALDASVGSLDTSIDQLSKRVDKLQTTSQAAVDTARLGTMGVPANQVAAVSTIVREDPEIADMVRRGLVKPASLVYPSYVSSLKRELRQSSAVAVGPDGKQLVNAAGEPRYSTSTSRPNTLHRGRIARSKVPVFERTGSIPSRRTPGLKYFRPARASRPNIFSTA